MFCPNCGRDNGNAAVCSWCSTRITTKYPPVQWQPVQPRPVQQPNPAPPQEEFRIEITEEHLPDKYQPLSGWGYFGLRLLFAIPFLGFIFLIVFSFSNDNINMRNFARSYWCEYFIIGIIFLICLAAGVSFLDGIFEFLS